MAYEELKKDLEKQLADLLQRVGAIEGELQQPLDQNSYEDQAQDIEDDEALAGVDQVLWNEIEQIRESLARIENGTYGK